MNLSFPKNKSRAFALMALMASIVVILIVFSGAMYWVMTNAKQERKNQEFTTSEAAAEGATEVIFAHMDRDYLYGNLDSTASNYISLTPTMTTWPVQYTFNSEIDMGAQVTGLSYLASQYTNLLGVPQTNTITVTALPQNELYNVPATVSQTFIFATVPVFQFAIFYNLNLEIDPGATMPIGGPVFSNQGIWSGTPNVTYSSIVEAAGQVNTTGTDPFCSSKTDTGTPQANFLYTSTPAQPESNVNPLILPIGTGGNNGSTNVEAIVNLPPSIVAAPNALAYQQTNQVYAFNAASLIVSNWYYGTNGVPSWSNNFTVYLQDSVTAPYAVKQSSVAVNWVQLTNDFYICSNATTHTFFQTNYVPNFQFTNNVSKIHWIGNPTGQNTVWYAGFSFLTNAAFYDFREGALAQAVQLDVGKLGTWITNCSPNGGSNWNQELCQDIGHGINSVFIYNAVPFVGQQQLPAVRVVDGGLLPSSTCFNITSNGTNYSRVLTTGLTVVTPQPLYVLGDYNVQTNGGPVVTGQTNAINTYPAAFMADSITVLASSWVDQDASAAGTYYPVRPSSNTTVNAACLEGIVPSVGSSYCGGVENFMRLLQNWGSLTLTYNGSIIVMFQSQYATNLWQAPSGATSYYAAPVRNWSFDTNFLTAPGLPPLTPSFRTVVRSSWTGY
jgi:type II secretory pathway pseudopilin PulG